MGQVLHGSAASRINVGIDAGVLAMDIYRFDGHAAVTDPVTA